MTFLPEFCCFSGCQQLLLLASALQLCWKMHNHIFNANDDLTQDG